MTNSITFTVEGVPVGKARPRITRRGNYTPGKTVAYETAVAAAATGEMGAKNIFDGPVAMTVAFNFPVPKSWGNVKQYAALLGDIRPGKPDIDNLQKAIADALNGIVYDDDKQIAESYASKRYSELPGATVTVRAL